MLYPAQTVKPSLKLRAYAYALNIPRERRDLLLEEVDTLVTAFAENSDVELLARAIVTRSKSGTETRFFCHGVDEILRRRFGSPYRARAMIFVSLSGRCAEMIGGRPTVFPPASQALEKNKEGGPCESAQSPRTLLVVGDSDLRELLAETLRAFPSDAIAVDDGLAAWAEINRTNFDVIVCEFFLSSLDGDALYAESKPHIRGRFIFLIGKSVYSDPKIITFREETNAPFITLPCSATDLTDAIAACLRSQTPAGEDAASTELNRTDAGAADHLCRSVAAKVISDLQEITDRLFGDESGLENLWEEICVQRQADLSVAWDTYEETVSALIEAHLEDLSGLDREAIWRQTDAGIEWECENLEQDEFAPPASLRDITRFIAERHVFGHADRFSNDRIVAFLNASRE